MALYWRMKSIPELAGLPRNERRRAWRDAYLRAHRNGAFKLPLVVFLLFVLLEVVTLVLLADPLLGAETAGGVTAFTVSVWVAFVLVFVFLYGVIAPWGNARQRRYLSPNGTAGT